MSLWNKRWLTNEHKRRICGHNTYVAVAVAAAEVKQPVRWYVCMCGLWGTANKTKKTDSGMAKLFRCAFCEAIYECLLTTLPHLVGIRVFFCSMFFRLFHNSPANTNILFGLFTATHPVWMKSILQFSLSFHGESNAIFGESSLSRPLSFTLCPVLFSHATRISTRSKVKQTIFEMNFPWDSSRNDVERQNKCQWKWIFGEHAKTRYRQRAKVKTVKWYPNISFCTDAKILICGDFECVVFGASTHRVWLYLISFRS